MDRRGQAVLCEKPARDKIALERSFSCVRGIGGQKGGLLNKTVSNLSLLCHWQSPDGWNTLLLLLLSSTQLHIEQLCYQAVSKTYQGSL